MRNAIVFVVLVGMFAASAFLLVTRSRTAMPAPPAGSASNQAGDGARDQAASTPGAASDPATRDAGAAGVGAVVGRHASRG